MAQFGLIEAGGTKFVLGVADESRVISARQRIPTTSPDETLPAAIAWFREQGLTPKAIGIASFGPLELHRTSAEWGYITRTTKAHWSDTDMVGPFAKAFGCTVGINTDVNGAALAESLWGAGRDKASTLYLTVGTGIGGGYVSDGNVLHGLSHPEMGHIRMSRHPDDTDFTGSCPFHGDCLEGLASGTAVRARWGAPLGELAEDHPAHRMEAWYLGQAVASFQAVLSPGCIILGGGVMETPGLLQQIRIEASKAGGGYFPGDPGEIVTAPGLGQDSGLLGALALAMDASV